MNTGINDILKEINIMFDYKTNNSNFLRQLLSGFMMEPHHIKSHSVKYKSFSNDSEFNLSISLPGYSKAKGKFKGSSLVVNIQGMEDPITFSLSEDFYTLYNIETLQYTFEHGILSFNVKAFPAEQIEGNDTVKEFDLGYVSDVTEVDFVQLKSISEQIQDGDLKDKVVKTIDTYANGHEVKSICNSKVLELSNLIANFKHGLFADSEADHSDVVALDLILNELDNTVHEVIEE